MRPVEPTRTVTADRDGATLHAEVWERDAPTIVLLPTWEIVDSRQWKAQIPYLQRHFRVVAYDAAGTGKSTGPDPRTRPERYSQANRMADAVAVLDATGTERAVAVGFSSGGSLALTLTAFHSERLDGTVALAPGHPRAPSPTGRVAPEWDATSTGAPQEWSKFAIDWWRRDYQDFVSWFMATVNSDAHSTKIVEDGIAWALEGNLEVPWAAIQDQWDVDLDELYDALSMTDVPVLIIHGDADTNTPYEGSVYLEGLIPTASLVTFPGADHPINARYPVWFNRHVHDFVASVTEAVPRTSLRPASPDRADAGVTPRTPLTSGGGGEQADLAVGAYAATASARRKALYLSSPIGLGHARRDLAIAQELRATHPDLEIEWLAQDPVTRVLGEAGETVHPASAHLASESAQFEADCGDHALDVFESFRELGPALVHNFHILEEVTASGDYDLVVGDEAWDLDHHLHENPDLKHTAFAWLTDFVGFIPMPHGGDHQARVCADYNLEMIEHLERHPTIRDISIFVGDPEDIVDATFGPGLPAIRDWTEQHYDFGGYITGFDPAALGDRERLRAELGFGENEKVCVIAVGGTAVGAPLLRRLVNAVPAARATIPQLRVIVVTGPRIDPATLPAIDGVEYHAYVDRLYRWLTACDVAVVQGGLTTTMELTAAKVPFIYVPLREHFEQNVHVHARLQRHRAGRRMDYDDITPAALTDALVDLLSTSPDYVDVPVNGARDTAALVDRAL